MNYNIKLMEIPRGRASRYLLSLIGNIYCLYLYQFIPALKGLGILGTSRLKIKKIITTLTIIFILIIPLLINAATIIKTRTEVIMKSAAGLPINQSTDVAVGKNGNIYVLDGVNNRVVVFDANGDLRFHFGRKGKGPGYFLYPVGIGIDEKDRIYVADSKNQRIQIFASTGEYINSFKIKESAQGGKEPDPTDILIVEDKIYIADNDNHRVVVYDKNSLEFLFEWGKNGFREGEFRYPFMIATNGLNKIYVVDVINARVQAFTPRGEYLHSIGQFGIKEGTFFRPQSVALDKNKRVFVTDMYTGVIQIFNEDGVLLGIVGNEFGKMRKFNVPCGLAIDSQNNLYVTEQFANTVSKLKILE